MGRVVLVSASLLLLWSSISAAERTAEKRKRIYKLEISRASLALRDGHHRRALRHLARARRAWDTPLVLHEYGFVHLSWATKLRGSTARAHLLKARGYYGQYLRRAPRGPLAKKARAGLRDIKRLLKRIAR